MMPPWNRRPILRREVALRCQEPTRATRASRPSLRPALDEPVTEPPPAAPGPRPRQRCGQPSRTGSVAEDPRPTRPYDDWYHARSRIVRAHESSLYHTSYHTSRSAGREGAECILARRNGRNRGCAACRRPRAAPPRPARRRTRCGRTGRRGAYYGCAASWALRQPPTSRPASSRARAACA